MNFFAKLSVTCALLMSCFSVYADGQLLYSDGGRLNYKFDADKWNKYVGGYKILSGTEERTNMVYGYSHCGNSIFMLQRVGKNGNHENLLFDSLPHAKKFEENLNLAIGPNSSVNFQISAYAETYDVVAVGYVERTAVMADDAKSGAINQPLTPITPAGTGVKIKLHYLQNKNNRTPEGDGCVF